MLQQEFPWVRVNPKTYDVEMVGTFQALASGPGHLMTYRTWEQIIKERNINPQGLYRYP